MVIDSIPELRDCTQNEKGKIVRETYINYFSERLGAKDAKKPYLLEGIFRKIGGVREVKIFIFGRMVADDQLEHFDFAPDESFSPHQKHIAEGTSDEVLKEYFNRSYPLHRVTRIYLNDSEIHLEWKKVFRGKDLSLYGDFDPSSEDSWSEFIDDASDFIHIGAVYKKSDDKDIFDNPEAAFISAFDGEGFILMEFSE